MGDSISEAPDGLQRQLRVDDGDVTPVDELAGAKSLDAQLDRPAAVGRGVEEVAGIEERADVEAAVRQPRR